MNNQQLDTLLPSIAEESARELRGYETFDMKAEAKKKVKQLLGRGVSKRDPYFWPAGMLALGLEEYIETAQKSLSDEEKTNGHSSVADNKISADSKRSADSQINACSDQNRTIRAICMAQEALSGRLEQWVTEGMKMTYLDDALMGYVLLRYCERTGKWGEEPAKLAGALYEMEKDEQESLIYRPGRGNAYILADGVGQSSMFLAKYAQLSGDTKARELAAKQLLSFARCGMAKGMDLPYHGYEIRQDTAAKLGIIGWGRAVGWLLLGVWVFLDTAPSDDPSYAEIESLYERIAGKVAGYQREDGGFSWQLEAVEGAADTSAAAMIGYALGGRLWQEDITGRIADFLLSHVTEKGEVTGALAECIDFAEHPQRYGNYPWGQGAALAFLASLHGRK